jgi:hypothetical protein
MQVGPTPSGVAAPLAAAAAEHPAPQQDAPEEKLAPKAGKEAKALPPRKQKTDTTAAEKPRSEKSAEALVRDALANIDANRRAPADAPTPGLTDTRSVPVDNLPPRRAIVPPQQPDVGPRPVEAPPRPAVEAVPYPTNVPLQPVQSRPAPSADLPPLPVDVRAAPPSNSRPLEIAAPQPIQPADRDKDVFSTLTRIPLLGPDPPAAEGDPPRPPMPIEKFGN